MFDQAVARARRADRGVLAMALSHQGYCLGRAEDFMAAVDTATEAIELLEPLAAEKPDEYGELLLVARWTVAVAYYEAGQLIRSVPALVRFLRLAGAVSVDTKLDPADAVEVLTVVLHRLSLPTFAGVELYPEAIELLRQHGDEDDARVADVLGWSVELLGDAGLVAEARAAGAEALSRYRRLGGHEARVAEVQRDLAVLDGESAQP